MARQKPQAEQPSVSIDGEVLRKIRQHARSSLKTEVCGVLIGEEAKGGLQISAAIAGTNAAQAGTHVTFTQDTWEHIYKVKDRDFPDARIVGWYHSHPGFGVFLSDHDTFIHKNFFSSPLQVAWVYDPHSDEEGCFGWTGDRLERLSDLAVTDSKGGEGAGETGKPEPGLHGNEGDGEISDSDLDSGVDETTRPPAWYRWTIATLSHLLIFAIGFLLSYLLFPKVLHVPVIVDPRTGQGYIIQRDGTLGPPTQVFLPPSAQQPAPTPPPAAHGENGKVPNVPKQ